MVSVVLGTKSGEFSFDISDVNLDSLKGSDPEYTVLKNGDLMVSQSKSDYVVLSGTFNFSGFLSGNYEDGIKKLDSITVVENGQVSYKASGLGMTGTEVGSRAVFDSYLAGKTYSINGNGYANEITAGDQNDILRGLSGNDTVYGEGGADKLFGDIGNDRLVGGEGNDFLTVGAGADIFAFSSGDGSDFILDFQAKGKGQDRIDLSDHDDAGSFAYLEIRDAGKNVVITVGDDTITLKNVNDHDVGATDFIF
jgi:Ca2+-binding RTX toxin-like protein